jgi:hypothetical protein
MSIEESPRTEVLPEDETLKVITDNFEDILQPAAPEEVYSHRYYETFNGQRIRVTESLARRTVTSEPYDDTILDEWQDNPIPVACHDVVSENIKTFKTKFYPGGLQQRELALSKIALGNEDYADTEVAGWLLSFAYGEEEGQLPTQPLGVGHREFTRYGRYKRAEVSKFLEALLQAKARL